MLVLTRRVGEQIRINDDIVITLLGVRGTGWLPKPLRISK